MTFAVIGSVRAPGTLDERPAVAPRAVSSKAAETDFLHLLAQISAGLGTQLDFHHVPGRLRLRAGTLKQHTAKLDAIRAEFEALPEVRSTTANRLTGSIVLDYDPSVLDADAVSAALRGCPSGTDAGFPGADHIGAKLGEWVLERLAIALIAAMV